MKTPSFRPRCPLCNTSLEGCGFPLPNKGRGFCPTGMCMMEFEVDVDESKISKDKNGKLVKTLTWKIGNVDNHR